MTASFLAVPALIAIVWGACALYVRQPDPDAFEDVTQSWKRWTDALKMGER